MYRRNVFLDLQNILLPPSLQRDHFPNNHFPQVSVTIYFKTRQFLLIKSKIQSVTEKLHLNCMCWK